MMRVPLLSSLALVLGGLVVVYLYQEQFRLERSGGPAVEVVTATQDIPFGEPIRAEWDTVRTAAVSLANKGEIKKAATALKTFHRRLCHNADFWRDLQ